MNEYSRQFETGSNNAIWEDMQATLAAANRLRTFAMAIILAAVLVIIALQTWSMQKIEKGVSNLNEQVVHLNSLTEEVAEHVYDIKEQKKNSLSVTGQQYIVVQ